MTDYAVDANGIKLLPCPFCGSRRLHIYALDDGVRCWECSARIVGVPDWMERWNRRIGMTSDDYARGLREGYRDGIRNTATYAISILKGVRDGRWTYDTAIRCLAEAEDKEALP